MATNNIITPSELTKESLRILHNNLGFVKGVNKEYSGQFGQVGGKIGQSINVRKPNRYVVQQGPSINPQGTTESTVPLTLDRQWVVPMTFSSKELTLSLDEFSKRYIQPAMAKLASQIDLDCLSAAVAGSYVDGTAVAGGEVPIHQVVGTPGTTPGTSGGSATGLLQYNAPMVYLNAGMMLDNQAAPRDKKRSCGLNPAAHASSVAGLSGLFNPQGVLSEQYRNGMLGNALGFDFYMDQNMPTYTSGTIASLGTVTLTAASATATFAGGTASKTITAGTIFTVAGVYAVNPENQQSTGLLQQFVVTAAASSDGSGNGSLSIFPTPVVAASTTAVANVTAVGAGAGTILTGGSGTATAYAQNLAYHEEAFTLGTCDMEIPNGLDFSARDTYDGISMRILRDYNIVNDFVVCRCDVLGGFATLRSDLACRITG